LRRSAPPRHLARRSQRRVRQAAARTCHLFAAPPRRAGCHRAPRDEAARGRRRRHRGRSGVRRQVSGRAGFSAFRHFSTLVLVLGCFVLLGAEAARLQWEQGEFLKKQGQARAVRTVTVKPNRGRIVDRNGEILAVSTPVDSIAGDGTVLCAEPGRFAELSEALALDADAIAALCRGHADSEFFYLKR